jgi:hypothetical protein
MKLTDREQVIYDMVLDGASNQDIAYALDTKLDTISKACSALKKKVKEWPCEDTQWERKQRDVPQQACVDANAFFELPPAKVRYKKSLGQLRTSMNALAFKVLQFPKNIEPREQTITSINNIMALVDEAIDCADAVIKGVK